MKVVNTETAIAKAHEVHGDTYDYTQFIFIKSNQKSTIICQQHGPFQQSPNNHLRGKGCPGCVGEKIRKSKAFTFDQFTEKSHLEHNNKYDYSKFNYINGATKSTIICPTHGEFQQAAAYHMKGVGCPKCGFERSAKALFKWTKERFSQESSKIHGNKYNYNNFEYVTYTTKGVIECPSHGVFMQSPANHLIGKGCPNCNTYVNEEICRRIFKELTGKDFIKVKPDFLRWEKGFNLELDGFCEDEMIAFEYNGQQHYKCVTKFHKSPEDLIYQQRKDEFKVKKCEEIGILLIVIPYQLRTHSNIRNFIIKELNDRGAYAF